MPLGKPWENASLHVKIIPTDALAIAKHARKLTGQEDQKRAEILEKASQFFAGLKEMELAEISVPEEIGTKLDALSVFVARARTGVSRDRSSKVVEYIPAPEGPGRLVRELVTLGRGIAIAQGKRQIWIKESMICCFRWERDSLPSNRNLLLQAMWQEGVFGEKWASTRELAEALGRKPETVRIWLDDLWELKVVEQKMEENSKKSMEYRWRLSDDAAQLIHISQIYGK